MVRGVDRGIRMLERGEKRSVMLSRGRMGIVLLAIVVCGLLYHHEWFVTGNLVLVGWLALFLIVVYYHNRLEDGLARLRLWIRVKQTNVARLQLDWGGIPESSLGLPADHPYGTDLDLVKGHSLLRLLDTTVSNEGQTRPTPNFLSQTIHGDTTAHTRRWPRAQSPCVRDSTSRSVSHLVRAFGCHDPLHGPSPARVVACGSLLASFRPRTIRGALKTVNRHD